MGLLLPIIDLGNLRMPTWPAKPPTHLALKPTLPATPPGPALPANQPSLHVGVAHVERDQSYVPHKKIGFFLSTIFTLFSTQP